MDTNPTPPTTNLLDLETLEGWELLFAICRKAIADGNFSCSYGRLLVPVGGGYAFRIDACDVDVMSGTETLASVKHNSGVHREHNEELMAIRATANLKVMMGILGECTLK